MSLCPCHRHYSQEGTKTYHTDNVRVALCISARYHLKDVTLTPFLPHHLWQQTFNILKNNTTYLYVLILSFENTSKNKKIIGSTLIANKAPSSQLKSLNYIFCVFPSGAKSFSVPCENFFRRERKIYGKI